MQGPTRWTQEKRELEEGITLDKIGKNGIKEAQIESKGDQDVSERSIRSCSTLINLECAIVYF